MSPSEELLFSGSTTKMVPNPGNPVRGSTDRNVALWFVRVDGRGQVLSIHHYEVNLPSLIYGASTTDGGLVSVRMYAPLQGGSEVPLEPIYTWVMKIDADGHLAFQRRFSISTCLAV